MCQYVDPHTNSRPLQAAKFGLASLIGYGLAMTGSPVAAFATTFIIGAACQSETLAAGVSLGFIGRAVRNLKPALDALRTGVQLPAQVSFWLRPAAQVAAGVLLVSPRALFKQEKTLKEEYFEAKDKDQTSAGFQINMLKWTMDDNTSSKFEVALLKHQDALSSNAIRIAYFESLV